MGLAVNKDCQDLLEACWTSNLTADYCLFSSAHGASGRHSGSILPGVQCAASTARAPSAEFPHPEACNESERPGAFGMQPTRLKTMAQRLEQFPSFLSVISHTQRTTITLKRAKKLNWKEFIKMTACPIKEAP